MRFDLGAAAEAYLAFERKPLDSVARGVGLSPHGPRISKRALDLRSRREGGAVENGGLLPAGS